MRSCVIGHKNVHISDVHVFVSWEEREWLMKSYCGRSLNTGTRVLLGTCCRRTLCSVPMRKTVCNCSLPCFFCLLQASRTPLAVWFCVDVDGAEPYGSMHRLLDGVSVLCAVPHRANRNTSAVDEVELHDTAWDRHRCIGQSQRTKRDRTRENRPAKHLDLCLAHGDAPAQCIWPIPHHAVDFLKEMVDRHYFGSGAIVINIISGSLPVFTTACTVSAGAMIIEPALHTATVVPMVNSPLPDWM